MTAEPEYIDIVFDGEPGPDAPRFVEAEDPNRWSVKVGRRLQRDDGYWVLRITPADTAQALYQMPRKTGWYLDKNGDLIHVDGDRYKRPGQHAYNDFHYREFAPFIRLVPESVTAEGVTA